MVPEKLHKKLIVFHLFFIPYFSRKRKELIKSTETAEERRLRRLAKKERKQKKYDRLMGVDDLGYSNTNNPFGDTKLTENFVWSKVGVIMISSVSLSVLITQYNK